MNLNLEYYSPQMEQEERDKSHKMIQDIIDDMPYYSKEDPNYELKVFTYIYVKLSFLLEYDNYAAELIDAKLGGRPREVAYDGYIEPASDLRSLARGKALCSGFTTILCHILEKLNIDAIYISQGTHAWNQVCLDGVWYNCDLTWDYSFIQSGLKCPYFLKSNQDCCEVEKYGIPSNSKQCLETISDEMQEQLITSALNYIKAKEEEKEASNNIEKSNYVKIIGMPVFIEKILSFFNKSQGGKSI